MKGFNGSLCGIYKFYETIIEGESEQTPAPKWSGIDEIRKVLNGISGDGLNQINIYAGAVAFQKAQALDKFPIETTVCETEYSGKEEMKSLCNYVKEKYTQYDKVSDLIAKIDE